VEWDRGDVQEDMVWWRSESCERIWSACSMRMHGFGTTGERKLREVPANSVLILPDKRLLNRSMCVCLLYLLQHLDCCMRKWRHCSRRHICLRFLFMQGDRGDDGGHGSSGSPGQKGLRGYPGPPGEKGPRGIIVVSVTCCSWTKNGKGCI